jgi:phage terminase large subunit-like protein
LLPESAPYLDAYRSELTGFPGTKYADQVDSTSQALEYLKSNYSLFVWERYGKAIASSRWLLG